MTSDQQAPPAPSITDTVTSEKEEQTASDGNLPTSPESETDAHHAASTSHVSEYVPPLLAHRSPPFDRIPSFARPLPLVDPSLLVPPLRVRRRVSRSADADLIMQIDRLDLELRAQKDSFNAHCDILDGILRQLERRIKFFEDRVQRPEDTKEWWMDLMMRISSKVLLEDEELTRQFEETTDPLERAKMMEARMECWEDLVKTLLEIVELQNRGSARRDQGREDDPQ